MQRKQIFFRAFPTLILIVVLVVGELALRQFIPSLGNPLVSEQRFAGMQFYEVNRRYLHKYFPGTTESVLPELKPSLFRKHKDKNLVRIMCLGESTMFGVPYQLSSTIPSIVQKQLRHLFPDREFEVINIAASAINSNVVRDLSQDLLEYEPDIILLYLGHNEYYGPDGVGAGFIERHLPWLIQTKYRLSDLRLVSLLRKAFPGRPAGDVGYERNLMREVSRNQYVRLQSDESGRIIRLFGNNLGTIIRLFHSENIPVVVSDVTANIMFPPFASDSLEGEEHWSEIKSMVGNEYTAGHYRTLAETLKTLVGRDTSNAFLQYWLGRTEVALGEYAAARAHLVAAKDNDLLKFRAPEEINVIIRKVCSETGTAFISSDSLFSALSPHSIPGENLFWEHLHPTSRGYYAIADLFVEKIIELGLINGHSVRYDPRMLLPYDRDSLSISWLDIAYADLAIEALTKHWPFYNYARAPEMIQSEDSVLVGAAQRVFLSKITWNEGCYVTALRLQQLGQFRDARTTYEALLEDTPFDYYAHYALGNLLKDENLLEEATLQFRQSIKFNPNYPFARVVLGLVEIDVRDYDSAIRDLSTALPLVTGRNLPVLEAFADYGLAAAYYGKGDRKRASLFIRESLRLNPSSSASRSLAEKLGEDK